MNDLDIPHALVGDIRAIWTNSRESAVRSVNSELVKANWLIGQRIVEEEQAGSARAEYGNRLLEGLSHILKSELGDGFSVSALRYMRLFYLKYPDLLSIHHALRDALSWTHFRVLLKVEPLEVRRFYEIEAVKNGWSARHLERQINSQLFFRLQKSQDRAGMLEMATLGQIVHKPLDAIKDPYVLEFLDLPESNRLTETDLEAALISRLQDFLMELGSGFAFVGRQKRLTLEGDHFYPDLVFYHTKLKCYVIIDLKVDKLSHADLGQMQLYVHFYDREVADANDGPTIGLVLCTDKNDTMVKYVLGDAHQQIFASRYQFQMPTEEQLRAELLLELAELDDGGEE